VTSAPRVLYLIICGTPAAPGAYDFITDVIHDGWKVCAVTTPMGARFVDSGRLAALTGHPVRSTYKNPEDPDVLPPGDAFVVAPASFNTVNKMANGISDTLAVGLLCEAIGLDKPVIVVPWTNRGLARNGAYGRSIQHLRDDGARLVLTERTEPGPSPVDPGGVFPWEQVLAEVRKITDDAT
jgi:phosphopantothenoylcysteine synthetase/decarboxylase